MAHENLIGEYLRARRELVRPEDVGVPDLGSRRRRVPGLRREEVALLAGVSSDSPLCNSLHGTQERDVRFACSGCDVCSVAASRI
jgi:hypothetical protein